MNRGDTNPFSKPPSPSLADIRRDGQKSRHREEGNWLARRWARPAAVYGTWVALRLGISAHAITAAAGIAWLFEAIALSCGNPKAFLAGIALGYLGFWLDHVDGQVARVRRSDTLEGIFLDFWIHTAHACLRGFGLGWGLFVAIHDPIAIIGGMSAAFGWMMISHTNDAGYKAIFAELKKLRDRHVEARLRFQEPADIRAPLESQRNSRRSWISWALVKFQEPHCVLMAMTALGAVYLVDSHAGLLAWRMALAFWAFTAPTVAIVRLARKVRGHAITAIYGDWFEIPSDSESAMRQPPAE